MTYRTTHPRFVASLEYYGAHEINITDALWNFLAYGLGPGSFVTAVLRNNFINAACCAHPALTLTYIRNLAKWVVNCAPPDSWGSYDNMLKWEQLTDDERLDIMVEYKLRPSIIDILKGEAKA